MSSTNATQTFLETLKRQIDLWSPPRPWGVGYSGGRDSGVLLWGLTQLVAPSEVVALHVDHGWRPEAERRAEAELAAQWCRRLGVTLQPYGPPARPQRTEAAARHFRYGCFETFAEGHPGSPIFLAHHADDQAETILMRLLRGRSWQGLGGMADRRGPFLRPLLSLRATVLAGAAREQSVPYHEDSTNEHEEFARNFLRGRVFPLLNERFPAGVEALNSFGAAWRMVAPAAEADPLWRFSGSSAKVAAEVWDRWSSVAREAQLLAVSIRLSDSVSLSRRFLETVVRDRRVNAAEGAGWRWKRDAAEVQWETVVQPRVEEYLILAQAGNEYAAGSYAFTWSAAEESGTWFVPGPQPQLPVLWRSVTPGMRLASAGEPDWGKETRRSRLGSLDPRRCAVLLQGGLVRAALDPALKRVLWSESGHEKLHKTGIFVKLRQRSDYERR